MSAKLEFRRLRASDPLTIELQPSQETVLGLDARMEYAEAEHHAQQPVAWTAFTRGRNGAERIVACFGLQETFPGHVGVGWAMLAAGVGAHHLQLTRFVRNVIATAPLARIEVMARAADIEPVAAAFPHFDPWQLVQAAMERPTPECRWAQALGLKARHVLRRFGMADETYMLFERVRA